MMERLIARAEAIAHAAQLRQLERVAAGMRLAGLKPEIGTDSIIVRGRGLFQRWLGDPLLRFVGRSAS